MTDQRTLTRLIERWEIYHDFSSGHTPDNLPWAFGPLDHLKAVVSSGKVPKGKALDVGCSVGQQTVFLAKKGFDCLGIDISPSAIINASESVEGLDLPCRFLVMDALDLRLPDSEFDFILDRNCFDHVPKQYRPVYAQNIDRVMKPEGRFLLYYLSDKNTAKHLPRIARSDIHTTFIPFFEIEETSEVYVNIDTHRLIPPSGAYMDFHGVKNGLTDLKDMPVFLDALIMRKKQ